MVDEVEEAPSLEAKITKQKDFKRYQKKSIRKFATNLDESNFVKVIYYKEIIDAKKTFCNVYKNVNLSYVLLSR